METRLICTDHIYQTPFARELKGLVGMAAKVRRIDEKKHRDLVEFRREAEEWLEVGGQKERKHNKGLALILNFNGADGLNCYHAKV